MASCALAEKDEGCNGGIMENAYAWVIANGGITTETLYPYTSGTGVTGMCQTKKITVKKAHISDYCDIVHDDEKDLEQALAQQVRPTHSALRCTQARMAMCTMSRSLLQVHVCFAVRRVCGCRLSSSA